MSVRVRSVVKFRAECTEPKCPWHQLHDNLGGAAADANRHRREWHPRADDDDEQGCLQGTDEPILTDDESRTVQNWITGIERRAWNPTPATKRYLADILRRILLTDQARRP